MKKSYKKIKAINFNLTKLTIATGLAVTVSLTSHCSSFADGTNGYSSSLPTVQNISGATAAYSNGTNVTGASTTANSFSAAEASNSLNINVNSNVADINCYSYSVAAGKTVNYNFTSAGQVAVNRVGIGAPASAILGNINQTGTGGTVYLINPNGILFGNNSVVNLNSFFASTQNLVTNINDLATTDLIEFERGDTDPESGIYVSAGATIGTKTGSTFNMNNLALVSNAIYNKGNIKSKVVNFVTGDGVNFEVEATGEYLVDEIIETEISDLDADVIQMPDGSTEVLNGSIYHGGNINTNSAEIKSRIDSDITDGNPFASIVNIDGIITADASSAYQGGGITLSAKNMHPDGYYRNDNAGVTVDSTLTSNSVTGTPYFYAQLGEVGFEADQVTFGADARVNYGNIQFNVNSFTVDPNFVGLFSNNTGSLYDVHLATMADDINPFESGHIDVYNKINNSKGIVIGKIPIEVDLGFTLWKANVDSTGYDPLELRANTIVATQGDVDLTLGDQNGHLLSINGGFNIWDGYDSGNEARSVSLTGANLYLGRVFSQNAIDIVDQADNSGTGLVIANKLIGKDISLTYDTKDNFLLTSAILLDNSGNFKLNADNINFINTTSNGLITLTNSITDTRSGTLSFKASNINIVNGVTFNTSKDIIIEDTKGNMNSSQISNYLSSLGSSTSDYTIKLLDSAEGNGNFSIDSAINTQNKTLSLESNSILFDSDVTKGKISTGSGDLKLTADHIELGDTVLGETSDYSDAIDDTFLSESRFNFNSLELNLSNNVYLDDIDFSSRNSSTGAAFKLTSAGIIGVNTGASIDTGSKDLTLTSTGFKDGTDTIGGSLGTAITNTNLLDKLVNTGTLSLNITGAGTLYVSNLASAGRHFILSASAKELNIDGQIDIDTTHNLSITAKNLTGIDQLNDSTLSTLFGDHQNLALDVSYASDGTSTLSIGDITHTGGDLLITTYADSSSGNIDFAFSGDGIDTGSKDLYIRQKTGTMRLNDTNLNKLNGNLITLEAQNGNIEFRASSGTEIDLGSDRNFVFKNTSDPTATNGLMFTGSDGDGQEHYIIASGDSSLKFESDNNTVTSLYFELEDNSYISVDSGMMRLFGVNDSTLTIDEIKAPGDIYIEAASIQAKDDNSTIESEAGQLFKGGLYLKADSIFTESDGSNVQLSYMPTITTSNAGIIFAPLNGDKITLTSSSSVTDASDTLFVFTDSFNKIQASEGFPQIMIGDGNEVDISSSDFYLGKTNNGVGAGEIALVANTTGDVDLTFSGADVLSILSVDRMNPFMIQRNIDEGTGEAASIYIHDATKNAFVRVTYDGTYFTYGDRTLVKDTPTVGIGREDMMRLLMRLAPGIATDDNIEEILNITSVIAAVPGTVGGTTTGTNSLTTSGAGNITSDNAGSSGLSSQDSNIIPVGDITPQIP